MLIRTGIDIIQGNINSRRFRNRSESPEVAIAAIPKIVTSTIHDEVFRLLLMIRKAVKAYMDITNKTRMMIAVLVSRQREIRVSLIVIRARSKIFTEPFKRRGMAVQHLLGSDAVVHGNMKLITSISNVAKMPTICQ